MLAFALALAVVERLTEFKTFQRRIKVGDEFFSFSFLKPFSDNPACIAPLPVQFHQLLRDNKIYMVPYSLLVDMQLRYRGTK